MEFSSGLICQKCSISLNKTVEFKSCVLKMSFRLIFQVPIVIGTCVAKFVSKTVPGHNWPITEFLYNKKLFNL